MKDLEPEIQEQILGANNQKDPEVINLTFKGIQTFDNTQKLD